MSIEINKLKFESIINRYAPYLFLLLIFSINVWFLFTRGAAYFDSDMASDFLLGNVYNTEKSFLSQNFYYSQTGIALLTDANIYQIALLIFPNNWIFARALGVSIMLLLVVSVYLLLSRHICLNKDISVLFASFVISPISYFYFLMITFGGYYCMLIVNSLLIITLYLSIVFSKSSRKMLLFKYMCIILYSVILGINGIKYFMFPVGPILLTSIFLFAAYIRNGRFLSIQKNELEINSIKTSVVMFGSYIFGYATNMLVLSKMYTFTTYSDVQWGKFSINALLDGISGFLGLFGFQYEERIYELRQHEFKTDIFSLQGIASGLGILIAAFLVYSVVRLVVHYNKLDSKHRVILILFISSLIVGVFVTKWTTGHDVGPNYLIPIMPLAFMVMQMEVQTDVFSSNITSKALPYLIAVFIFITSLSTIKQYEDYPLFANPQLVNVATWLEDNDYRQGYATFWQCNAITVLTNGKIEMWNVWGFDNLICREYMQKKDHKNPPTDNRVFALIGPDDELDSNVFLQYMDTSPGIPEIVYQDDYGYIVVEYK